MFAKSYVALLLTVLGIAALGCGSDSDDGAAGSGGSAGAAGAGGGGIGGSSGQSGSAGTGGSAGSSGSSSCVDTIARYFDNTPGGTSVEPGTKAANKYGLYDMLGNSAEWVQDCYHDTYANAPTDGTAWDETTCDKRVMRGGCYGSTARQLRASARDGFEIDAYGACAPGVRCVRTSSQVPSTAKITLTWVPIAAGSFSLGCSTGDADCGANESPAHTVNVAAFEINDKEVTQQQYFDQTGDNPASIPCPACAATYVNWDKAQAFCEALGGRLPTEAEWEYAARGGTTTRYYCGDN